MKRDFNSRNETSASQNQEKYIFEIELINIQGLTQSKAIELDDRVRTNTLLCITETQQTRNRIKFKPDKKSIEQMRTRDDRKGGGLMIVWNDTEHVEVKACSSRRTHN